jgi:tetratricopeptide (TPR) repeat protein
MNTNQHAAAIAAAEEIARQRPGDFTAFEELGHAYFEDEQYDAAMVAYRRASELNPRSARAIEATGHIYYRQNNPQAAIAAYEKAIAVDPHFTKTYYGLGILHATITGDYEKAIAAYQRGLVENPGDPFLTANLGSTYARMGQIERAVEMLEEAARRDPGEPFAWGWLAILYLHQYRFDDMLAACRRVNEIEDDHSSNRMIGFVHHARGRMEEAAAALERAIQIEADDYEARAALARVYREMGRPEAADEQYRVAWETAWQDEEYGRACVCAVSGDFDQALALLETSLTKRQVMPGWARIDPEFAFLQRDARFQVLVN